MYVVTKRGITSHIVCEFHIGRISILINREVTIEIRAVEFETVGTLHIGLFLLIPRALMIRLRCTLNNQVQILGVSRHLEGCSASGISLVHIAIHTAAVALQCYKAVGQSLVAAHLVIGTGTTNDSVVTIHLITRITVCQCSTSLQSLDAY